VQADTPLAPYWYYWTLCPSGVASLWWDCYNSMHHVPVLSILLIKLVPNNLAGLSTLFMPAAHWVTTWSLVAHPFLALGSFCNEPIFLASWIQEGVIVTHLPSPLFVVCFTLCWNPWSLLLWLLDLGGCSWWQWTQVTTICDCLFDWIFLPNIMSISSSLRNSWRFFTPETILSSTFWTLKNWPRYTQVVQAG
jgi:hypothetical protein